MSSLNPNNAKDRLVNEIMKTKSSKVPKSRLQKVYNEDSFSVFETSMANLSMQGSVVEETAQQMSRLTEAMYANKLIEMSAVNRKLTDLLIAKQDQVIELKNHISFLQFRLYQHGDFTDQQQNFRDLLGIAAESANLKLNLQNLNRTVADKDLQLQRLAADNLELQR